LVDNRPEPRPASIVVQPAGALGDTLLAYPAVAALRIWAPTARITLAARFAYGSLAQSAGLVDRVADVDRFAVGSEIVESDGSTGPAHLAVVWSSAYGDVARRFEEQGTVAILAAPPFPDDNRHQARYLLDCLTPLGIPRTLTQAPLPFLPPLSATEEGLLGRNGPPVLLHPGAGARWKQWPIDSWLALADALRAHNIMVRWSQGPDDEEVHDALLTRRPALRSEFWPIQPLPRFAALLARCRLLVSSDTGAAHLGALMRVPQITMFGPTDPKRWRPLSRFAALVRAPELCGGGWESVDDSAGPPRLRRCPDRIGKNCLCLAALPAEAILSQALRIVAGRSPVP
jgi:ADP-heptose:LPS heptosyltransferase